MNEDCLVENHFESGDFFLIQSDVPSSAISSCLQNVISDILCNKIVSVPKNIQTVRNPEIHSFFCGKNTWMCILILQSVMKLYNVFIKVNLILIRVYCSSTPRRSYSLLCFRFCKFQVEADHLINKYNLGPVKTGCTPPTSCFQQGCVRV